MAGEQDKIVEIPFPLAGVEEYRALEHGRVFNGRNSAATTQSALNVRGVDPRSGRARGGSREGLSKYNPTAIVASTSIQDINSLPETTVDPISGSGQLVIGMSNAPIQGYRVVSSEGDTISSDATLVSTLIVQHVGWDESGNSYVLMRNDSTVGWTLRKLSAAGVIQWSTNFSTAGASTLAGGLVLGQTRAYCLVRTSANQAELWRFEIATGVSTDGAAWKSVAGGTLSNYSQSTTTSGAAAGNRLSISTTVGILGVMGNNGAAVDVRLFNTSTGTQIANTVLNSGGFLLSYNIVSSNGGTFWLAFGDGSTVNLINGVGSTGSVLGASTYAGGIHIAYDRVNSKLWGLNATGGVLEFGLTAPFSVATGPVTVDGGSWLRIHAHPTGFVLARTDSTNARIAKVTSSINLQWYGSYINGNPRAVAVNLNSSVNTRFVRTVLHLAVCGGNIAKFTRDSIIFNAGGIGAISSAYPVIFSAQQGSRLYYANPTSYVYYRGDTNSVVGWVPSSGSLPLDGSGVGGRLICLWRNRIVIAGIKDDAANWYMSAVGDALNWNYAPATPTSTQAVAGNNSSAGRVGDIINSLVPYNDDTLIFGGDHSIYMMRGDPAAGGSIDRISDETGMSYGRPWCRSPDGVLYFFGSRGGVYRMVPGGIPDRMTSRVIDERLAEVDLGAHLVRMAWSDRQQGVKVWISPYDSTQSTMHFYWDARNDAWWIDQHASGNHNPLAVATIDGDTENDRALISGGRDGFLREVDVDATDDDGSAISSYVFLGPVSGTLKELQAILATGAGSVTWSTHAAETAQLALLEAAGATGTFSAGRNHSEYPRRYGSAVYLKLASSAAWALESLVGRLSPPTAGRGRRF